MKTRIRGTMNISLIIANDDQVVVSWTGAAGRSSLGLLAMEGRAARVNALGRDELLAVLSVSVSAAFPLGHGSHFYRETVAVVRGEVAEYLDDTKALQDSPAGQLGLGELRRAVVLKGGASMGGPLDTYLKIAVEAAARAGDTCAAAV
jgi:hypothetical protein